MTLTNNSRPAAIPGDPGRPHIPYASTTDRHWTGVEVDSPWIASAVALLPELAENAHRHDQAATFVSEGYDLLRRHRFMSMAVPAEMGGGGASFAELCAVVAVLARGCPSTSLAYSMHSHLVAAQVWRHNRDMPAPLLAKVAADETVLVSTGAADWMESNGTTVRVEGGYRVSARKAPASGCVSGDVVVTSFRWDDAPDGPQVLHAGLPFATEGVRIESTWDTLGMRGTGSDTIVLDDVFVPEAAISLARPADVWHPVWATVLGVALPLIMSTYVGVAEAAALQALELAAGAADRPETATLAGRVANRLTVARDSVRAMIDGADGLRFDNTLAGAAAALSRKSNATEACLDTLRLAMELGGGSAFSRSYDLERLFRDGHGAQYHPLPAARQERFTGRAVLGLPPL